MPIWIGEIVTQTEQAEMVNDVRLDAYPADPSNLVLANRYIFTSTSPEGAVSSLALLGELTTAFLHPRENRYVAIATYGHGKSHFALALANFFGRPAESPEAQAILRNIAAVAEPDAAQRFREFKCARPPFLVLRLRGDQAAGLHQQVVRGLETALGEHEETRGAQLPFWYADAERFLASLSPAQIEIANAGL